MIPAAKPKREVKNLFEIEQERRREAGFPKVIEVTIDEQKCRLFVGGDDVYFDCDNCSIQVSLVEGMSAENWQYFEREELC